jgi:DNA-binding response OmpR family regulator
MKNENPRFYLREENPEMSNLLKVEAYVIGAYKIEVAKRFLTINGESTKLTTKEFQLLVLFAANLNEFLDRKYALRTIWKDDNNYNARSMDVYICKIRKLLKADPRIIIINIHGKGYKMLLTA